jgi:hypothetical protein
MGFGIFPDEAPVLDFFEDSLALHLELANRKTAVDILYDELEPVSLMIIHIDL